MSAFGDVFLPALAGETASAVGAIPQGMIQGEQLSRQLAQQDLERKVMEFNYQLAQRRANMPQFHNLGNLGYVMTDPHSGEITNSYYRPQKLGENAMLMQLLMNPEYAPYVERLMSMKHPVREPGPQIVPPGGAVLPRGATEPTFVNPAPTPPAQMVPPGGALVPRGGTQPIFQQPPLEKPIELSPDTKLVTPQGKEIARGVEKFKDQQEAKNRLGPAELKMQQENLDAIGTAGTINENLAKSLEQITSWQLPLGPMSNLLNKGLNVAGMSTPESRNLASFQANLEKMRNDSLRLNKGVQTEGDAVRAWNELMASINDPEVVKQRLQEIMALNDRAATLHQMNIDQIRENRGLPPLDASKYKAPMPGTLFADAPPGKNKGDVLRKGGKPVARWNGQTWVAITK